METPGYNYLTFLIRSNCKPNVKSSRLYSMVVLNSSFLFNPINKVVEGGSSRL